MVGRMGVVLGLIGYSFVAAVTPGPNNVLLWATGIRYGFRAAIPYVFGVVVGVGAMVLAVAAGVGVLVTAVPGLEAALKVVGSVYLLYLAWQVAGSSVVREADVARAPTFLQAVAFQFVNPKAWFFVLTAVGAFRPPDLDVVIGSLLMTVVIMAVVLPSASVWAAGGHALSGVASGPRAHRAVSVVLAVLLAGMVVFIWL
jgi:threonine/homoserine/homoserine lactone efflux protein